MEEQKETLREERVEGVSKMERRISGRILMLTVMVTVVALAVVAVCWMLTREKPEPSPKITNELVYATLEPASELTTARLTYCGLIHYSDGKIPLINKKAFSMLYCAEVEQGVDLSTLLVEVTDTTVNITIPKLEEADIRILPETIEFFDEKNSIFNPEQLQDTVDAILLAQEDVRQKADLERLAETAGKQAEVLILGLLQPVVEGRNVVVIHR